MRLRKLDEFMVKRGGSVDPSKFKNETFQLLSIPAFDQGSPDVVEGEKIGSSKKIVEPRDVLLSKIVPHIRRCWIVPERIDKRQIASGEWIQFRGDDLFPEYLRLYLISNRFHRQFMNTVKGVGGSLLRASPAQVAEIEIPVPEEFDDQIRIAHLLGKVEGLIAQRKQHLQQLDDLLKSVFLDMFGDPVRNERGWDKAPLEKLGSVNRGVSKHRPRNDPKLLGGKYPLIQTGEVSNAGTYITTYTQTYSEIGFSQSKQWPVGTLCITIAANIAQTGILMFEACFPDSVVGFIADANEANPLYVHGLFWFFQSILEKNAPAAAQKNINLEILRNLEVPKPPILLQNQFATVVEKIEGIKFRHQQSLTDLEALYGVLSQKAFKGELDLSRVPMPGIQPEDEQTVAAEPLHAPAEQGLAIHLPDTDNLLDALVSAEVREGLIAQWLVAYRGQLSDTPFSVQHFTAAAQTRLAELYPDNDFALGANDYEHIKAWVFDALAAGTLAQAFDDAGNRIELKAVQA
ncbi:restriction endonuclease subunit S [Polycyclovorans algicola]|uniref:restriction endonuclease subunit S n=1 Tax=Polycyclovorans algicola TaxID=616992 RepID=UPI000A7B497B|nr:restriction endonuclease subunit S [Polycyclovorans algicola]